MIFNTVGRTAEGFFRYQAWPTVVKAPDGTIYAAASGSRLGHLCPFGKNFLYISRDDGESWEGPIIANDTWLDDRDAGLCAWGESNLLLSWFNLRPERFDSREGKHLAGITAPISLAAREYWRNLPPEAIEPGSYLKLSQDGGKTWGDKIRVPVTSPHGPLCKKDGSLLYLGKIYMPQDPENYPNGQICAIQSQDGGKTWEKLGLVEEAEDTDRSICHEPHAIELADGTILGAIRVSPGKFIGDSTVHLTRSTDGGKTWTRPEPTGWVGTPPHLLLHSSGAIVMTYSCRVAPNSQRARISCDNGITWSEELVISPESPDWDHGYPSSVELSDGSILTVYYQKCPGDEFNSILSTRWQLPKK